MTEDELWPLNKFAINDKLNFIDLTVNDKKAELIRVGIYIPLKVKYNNTNNFEEEIKIGYFFNLNELTYDVNPLFIEAISDFIIYTVHTLADAAASRLKTDIQDLLKFNPDSQNVISFIKDKKKEYINKFLKLKDFEIGFPFIESHLAMPEKPLEKVIEMVVEAINEFDFLNELCDYITTEKYIEENRFVKVWIKAATFESCIYVCNEGINELENGLKEEILDINNNNFSLPQSINAAVIKIKPEMIFKEQHISLFQYMVTSYSAKKNKAFYSYLFHFFSLNGYLLKKTKSSVNYNRFLVENDLIDKFSKVIQKEGDNSDEEKRMFEIFQNFSLKFFEGKLKEN
jgi:hypothetical protein